FRSIDALSAASLEDMQNIGGVGPEIAGGVHAWLQEPENQALLEKLRRAGVRMKDQAQQAPAGPQPLLGKTVVITGTLPTLAREEATRLAEQAGAHVASSVSKKTTFVVVGESAGTKLTKAQSLGVEIVDESEFL